MDHWFDREMMVLLIGLAVGYLLGYRVRVREDRAWNEMLLRMHGDYEKIRGNGEISGSGDAGRRYERR